MKCQCCGCDVTDKIRPGALVLAYGENRSSKQSYQGVILGRRNESTWYVLIPLGETVKVWGCADDELEYRGNGTHLLPRFEE